MILTIVLVTVLGHGAPIESQYFRGNESKVASLMSRCEPYEDENHVCLMKTTRSNKDIVYTDLYSMNQFIYSPVKK